MFMTEDGREVETREEAATIYIKAWGYDERGRSIPNQQYGPFTPREVGYLEGQHRMG